MNYPTASMTLGSLTCQNLQAANLNFESTTVSTLTVLDSTTLLTSVNIQANSFATNEPLAVFDKEGNELYTLPTTEPSAGQVLTCPPSGTNLIWTNGGGGGGGQVDTIINTDGNLGITGTSDVTINLASDITIDNTLSALVLSGQVVVAPTVTLSGSTSGAATAINLPSGWTGSIDIGKAIISNGDNTSSWLDVVLGITNSDGNISITGSTANPIINLSNTILGATSIGAPIISSTQLLDVKGQLEDINNSVGQTGYLLSSTGSGIAWIQDPTGSVSTWAQNPADTDINTNGFQIQGVTGNFIDLNTDNNIQIGATGSVSITSANDRIDLYPDTYVFIDKGVQSSQITCTTNLGLLGTITDGDNSVGLAGYVLSSGGAGGIVTWIENQGGIPGATGATGQTGATGATGASGQNGTSSGLVLYMDIGSSTPVTGQVLNGTLNLAPISGTQVVQNITADNFFNYPVTTLTTPAAILTSTTINPGFWDMNLYAQNSSSTVGSVTYYIIINEVDADGTSFINTIATGNLASATPILNAQGIYTYSLLVPYYQLASLSSRIQVIVEANFASAGSAKTLTIQYRDNTVSHIHTTLSASQNWSIYPAVSPITSLSNILILKDTNIQINSALNGTVDLWAGGEIGVDPIGGQIFINDVSVFVNTNNGNNSWSFDEQGDFYLPSTGGNIYMGDSGSIVGNATNPVNINSNTQIWSFDSTTSDPTLNLPYSANISTSIANSDLSINSSAAILLTVDNGASTITFDGTTGELDIPNNLNMNNADIGGVSNIFSSGTNLEIFNTVSDERGAEVILNNSDGSISMITKNGDSANTLSFDANGNIILSNVTNNTYIQNQTGAIDMFVGWDGTPGGVWGAELYLDNTVAQITTNSSTKVWEFDANGNITLPAVNNTIISTPQGTTGSIDIYNYNGNTKGSEIVINSTSIELNTEGGASIIYDNANVLTFTDPGNIDLDAGSLINVSNVGNNKGSGAVSIQSIYQPTIPSEGCSVNVNTTDIELNVNNRAVTTTLNANGELTLPTLAMNSNAGLIFPDGSKQTIAYNPNYLKQTYFYAYGFCPSTITGNPTISFGSPAVTGGFGAVVTTTPNYIQFLQQNAIYQMTINLAGAVISGISFEIQIVPIFSATIFGQDTFTFNINTTGTVSYTIPVLIDSGSGTGIEAGGFSIDISCLGFVASYGGSLVITGINPLSSSF